MSDQQQWARFAKLLKEAQDRWGERFPETLPANGHLLVLYDPDKCQLGQHQGIGLDRLSFALTMLAACGFEFDVRPFPEDYQGHEGLDVAVTVVAGEDRSIYSISQLQALLRRHLESLLPRRQRRDAKGRFISERRSEAAKRAQLQLFNTEAWTDEQTNSTGQEN